MRSSWLMVAVDVITQVPGTFQNQSTRVAVKFIGDKSRITVWTSRIRVVNGWSFEEVILKCLE